MDQKVGASPGHFSWPRVLIGRHPRHTLLRLVLVVLASIGLFGYLLLPIRTLGISMLPTYESGSLRLVNGDGVPHRGDVRRLAGRVYLKRSDCERSGSMLAGRRVVYIKRINRITWWATIADRCWCRVGDELGVRIDARVSSRSTRRT